MATTARESPLESVLLEFGACMAVRHGVRVAAHYGSVTSETAVCLRSVGLADRFGRLTFEVRGAPELIDTALARLDRLGDAAWHARTAVDRALVRCERADEDRCRAVIDDGDLLVEETSDDHAALGLVGPRALEVMRLAGLHEAPFPAAVVPEPGGVEVLVPRESATAAWIHLLRSGEACGIACVGYDALEHLWITRGVRQ